MRQAFGQEHLSRKVDTLDYSMSNASTKVIQKVITNNPNITVSNNIISLPPFFSFHIFGGKLRLGFLSMPCLPHPAWATDEAVFIPKFNVYFVA